PASRQRRAAVSESTLPRRRESQGHQSHTGTLPDSPNVRISHPIAVLRGPLVSTNPPKQTPLPRGWLPSRLQRVEVCSCVMAPWRARTFNSQTLNLSSLNISDAHKIRFSYGEGIRRL